MMLDHVGHTTTARRVRTAIDETLHADNVRTGDLGGNASTKDMTAALVRRLR